MRDAPLCECSIYEHGDGKRLDFQLNLVGVELRHLDGLLDEVVEAVGLLIDDGEQLMLRWRVE